MKEKTYLFIIGSIVIFLVFSLFYRLEIIEEDTRSLKNSFLHFHGEWKSSEKPETLNHTSK